MKLYSLEKELKQISEIPFKKELEIQKIVESNLSELLSLEYVQTEYALNGLRVDTLAFNPESKSFVIIEYKRDKSSSVIDQGYAYLSLLLNNKADFILEYTEKTGKKLLKKEVDWSQSRVLFVSTSFNAYQRKAINFKDLPIELWKITKYINNTIAFEQINGDDSSESINTISKVDNTISEVSQEVKVYTESDHLIEKSDDIKSLYNKFKTAILSFDSVEAKPKKKYIAFKASNNIVDIAIQKNSLKMWINLKKGELDDPKELAADVSNIGHWGNGDYVLMITNDDNLEYIMSLIKQVVKKKR